MTTRTLLSTGLMLLLVIGTAAAETVEVPALPPDAVAGAPAGSDTLTLDLVDAFQLALARNLDLQVGRYNLASADSGILARSGIFDPVLGASVDGDYTESPSSSELEGALVGKSRNTRLGLGLSQLLPTGTQLDFQLGSYRSETNSLYYYLNPRWNSGFTASLRQPLLNGFGTLVNRANIVIARNNRDQTASAFAITVISTLLDVERAYWDLVAAREQVTVKQQSVDLATRLLNETGERVKVGTSAPIDLIQSEAGVATRRQELIYARNAASNAEDTLKALLGFDQPEEWLRAVEAGESYETKPFPADLASAIETALVNRPEIQQRQLALEALELYVKLARNAVLPKLDLEASYGFSGISGKGYLEIPVIDPDTGLPVVDPITGEPVTERMDVSTSWNDSMTMVRDADYPNWKLGVTLSVPLGNNEAEGTVAERRFELEKGKTELAALRQQVVYEVRRAVRALDDGAAAIDAAVSSRQLAERNLQAEYTKFNNGLSTNYQVLEIQQDLADAQMSELRARIDYRKALAGYRAATGTLLETVGVEIVDPGATEPKHDYWKDVEWLQFVDLKGAAAQVTQPPASGG